MQTGSAVLESPHSFQSTESLCLLFKYQISSPKIVLNVNVSSVASPAVFNITITLQYTDQQTVGKWSTGFVTLPRDVDRFRLEASKGSITTDVHFIILDDVEIKSCSDGN